LLALLLAVALFVFGGLAIIAAIVVDILHSFEGIDFNFLVIV
jgi:hypothetical protein